MNRDRAGKGNSDTAPLEQDPATVVYTQEKLIMWRKRLAHKPAQP